MTKEKLIEVLSGEIQKTGDQVRWIHNVAGLIEADGYVLARNRIIEAETKGHQAVELMKYALVLLTGNLP